MAIIASVIVVIFLRPCSRVTAAVATIGQPQYKVHTPEPRLLQKLGLLQPRLLFFKILDYCNVRRFAANGKKCNNRSSSVGDSDSSRTLNETL